MTDGSQEITLSAPEGAAQGFYDVTIAVTSDGTAYQQPASLTVTAPRTLLAAYDNTGISDGTGDHGEGAYDGGGWSYSRQAQAATGLTPGGQGTVDGSAFTWPNSPCGRPDNATGSGRAVQLT